MLAGCALVTQNECVVQDWHTQGVLDGMQGLLKIQKHEYLQACGENALAFNQSAYETGYSEGINRLCTKASGFEAGVAGVEYRNVCPAEKEGEFLVGYDAGLSLLVADARLRDEKLAFAYRSAPSEFIGTPPSKEGVLNRLETFPQTKETRRRALSQLRWSTFTRPTQSHWQTASGRNIDKRTEGCEAAKDRAKELGFVADDLC